MALAFDASSQGNQDSGTSVTFSHTTAGSNRILVVFVRLTGSGDTITGVTYNSVSMSSAGASVLSNDSNRRLYAFYLINPASSTNDIVITASSTSSFKGHAYSYTGAKQSGQPDSYNGASPSSTTTPSINLTPNLANCWAVIGATNNADDPSGTSNWSTRLSAGGQASGDSNGIVPASTIAYGMTYGSSVSNAMIAMSIAAANEASASSSQSPSSSASSSVSRSLSPSASQSPSTSQSPSSSVSASSSASASNSISPSLSPSGSQSPSSSASSSISPSLSPSSSSSPSFSASVSPSVSASPSPAQYVAKYTSVGSRNLD